MYKRVHVHVTLHNNLNILWVVYMLQEIAVIHTVLLRNLIMSDTEPAPQYSITI